MRRRSPLEVRLQRRLLHDFLLQHTLRAEDDTRRYLAALGAKGYDNLLALKLRVRAAEDLGELGLDKVRGGGLGGCVYLCICMCMHAIVMLLPSSPSHHTHTPHIPTKAGVRPQDLLRPPRPGPDRGPPAPVPPPPPLFVRALRVLLPRGGSVCIFLYILYYSGCVGLVSCAWFGFLSCVDGWMDVLVVLSCVASPFTHICTQLHTGRDPPPVRAHVREAPQRDHAGARSHTYTFPHIHTINPPTHTHTNKQNINNRST